MSRTLWIDPSASTQTHGDDRRSLFAPDGEFIAAVAGLRRTTQLLETLPDQLFLELYAYEMVERGREDVAPDPAAVCSVPFWPECLFWAADMHVHPWSELQGMLPGFGAILVVDCDEAVIARAADQVLGGLRFDPARYRQRLLAVASRDAWEVRRS